MHRKNLAKRINTMLTILLLLLLIPLFLTIFCQKMQLEELLGNVNRTAEKEEDADMLFCIVAKEISADAPEECIKAQCVIARTNLKAAEEMGTELPGREGQEFQIWMTHRHSRPIHYLVLFQKNFSHRWHRRTDLYIGTVCAGCFRQ